MSFHPDQNLPSCMMPDGGDCCAGHVAVCEDWHKQRREIEKLRSAILFWRMARYPENRPDPHDMEGRCQVQAALDLAENTLYELSKSAMSPSHRTNADVGGANPSGVREGKS